MKNKAAKPGPKPISVLDPLVSCTYRLHKSIKSFINKRGGSEYVRKVFLDLMGRDHGRKG